MKIALIQQVAGSDNAENVRRGIDATVQAAGEGANLVVFPELAFVPFFPQHRLAGERADLAETIPGPLTDQFCRLAAELGVVIVLNLYERDGDRYYDSSPVIDSDGKLLGVTRMIHITHYEGFYEQDYYDPGDTGAPVYETSAGRVGIAICYDRHYPEYMRALGLAEADIVVIPQAGAIGEWPEGVFEAEIQAAAFQNGYFAALANRVGAEDVLTFGGGSFVVNPAGQILGKAVEEDEEILVQELDLSEIAASPARQLFFKHRRDDFLKEVVNPVQYR